MDGIRPNDFPLELTPTDANFELYSQKGGINKRASLNALKNWFLAKIGGFVGYVPTPSGNTTNRGEFVTDPSGAVWYIDATGSAIKLSATTTQLYQDIGEVIGTTITTTITLPASGKEWRINLYRTGVRMIYGKDFTTSGNTITLLLAADQEYFTITVIPE